MYTNDLNSAYEYERERRNDDRRAAAESQRARGLSRKYRSGFLSPAMMIGILAVLITILRAL